MKVYLEMIRINFSPINTTGLALALIMSSLHLPALALPDDNQQPINIQSDRATQKSVDGSEIIEYFGHVVMTQGSLQINGDHIVIHSKDRKITKIKAQGNPARFQQQSDPQKAPIKARAETIDYQLRDETLTLETDAHINQEGTTVSGNLIEYNVASERVKAEERVNMVFIPESEDPQQDPDNSNTTSPRENNAEADSK